MLVLKCGNVPKNISTQQAGVIWTIASDILMRDVLDHSGLVTTSDGSYISPIELSDNQIVYASFIRRYTDGSEDYPSNLQSVTRVGSTLGCDYSPTPIIEKPTLRGSVGSDGHTNLISSRFRSNTDVHKSTSWVLVSEAGDLLFSSLYDEVNLLSINIPVGSYQFSSGSYIVAYVCHHAKHSSASASNFSRVIIEITSTNFDITTNLKAVRPNTNLTIILVPKTPNVAPNIVSYELLDSSGSSVYEQLNISKQALSVTVPGSQLRPKSDMFIVFSIDNGTATLTKTVYRINIIDQYLAKSIIDNYSYSGTYEVLTNNTAVNVDFNFRTVEIVGRGIIIPYYNGQMCSIVYNRETKAIDYGVSCFTGLSLLNTNYDETMLTTDSVNRFIIDTKDSNGIPTFLVYDYDFLTGVSNLFFYLKRYDEIDSLGTNNPICQYDGNKYLYYSSSTAELRVFDISLRSISTLAAVNANPGTRLSLIKNNSDNVLILGGSYVTSYTISTGILKEELVVDQRLTNRSLVTLPLINGDYLIYRADVMNGDTDCNMFLFRNNTNVFETVSLGLEYGDYLKASVILTTGEILFNGPSGFLLFT